MSNAEHLIENLIFGMKAGKEPGDILAEPRNQDMLNDSTTDISADEAVRIACHVVYSLYDGRYPNNDTPCFLERNFSEYEINRMRPYYHVFRNVVVSGIIPVDRAVSDWMNEMDELLEEQTTVYAVIEEYDPYVSHQDIESRAELNVQGIFKSLEKAVDIRNDLARHEAEEYDIEINEADYADPNRPISVLGSEFYIREFDVK